MHVCLITLVAFCGIHCDRLHVQVFCYLSLSLSLSAAMSSSEDIGHRRIAAERHARTSQIFDGEWRAGLQEVTITAGICSLSPNFQIDTDTRTCTYTHLGNTYSGSLREDGLTIKWSDKSTWTLVKAPHADEDAPNADS